MVRGVHAVTLALVNEKTITGINQEALEEWIEHRKDIKSPMTKRAIALFTNKLVKYSESEQMRLVEEGIERGWKSIYWVEPPKQQTTRQSSIRDDLTDTSWAN